MTEGQAIKIRSIFCNRIPEEELYTKLTDELATEMDNAITRQIPVQPQIKGGRFFGKAKGGTCPICESGVNSRDYQYCRKCGQKLDWESEVQGE